MDLDLVFLGTGGSMPTARRATASLLLRRGGDRLLFDCGEGTQRQLHRSVGLVALDEIYLTHFHADHYLGIPGLLKTYDLQGRERPLRILGPPGLRGLFDAIRRIMGRTRYEIELVELDAGEGVEHDGYWVLPYAVEHGTKAFGYAIVEEPRPGRFDAEAAERLGVAPGPAFGDLQRGKTLDTANGRVRPEDVMGEPRPGRKLVITGDTRACESTKVAAHRAELLIHDGSFSDEETERAAETGHATAREAAELADAAEVAMLALVHISSRYNPRAVLEEAREVLPETVAPRDFDLIEIPFAERGRPQLIKDGARSRPPEQPETAKA
ncbi:MAG: ribonuclease Z [Solirubrobacterales bacterium]